MDNTEETYRDWFSFLDDFEYPPPPPNCELLPGPWNNEPHTRQWVDIHTGLDCVAQRGLGGTWCGYVGISGQMPQHLPEYWTEELVVHGGVTFYDEYATEDSGRPRLRVLAGRPACHTWIGFDCHHFGDTAPYVIHYGSLLPGTYRTLEYVTEQIQRLALQIHQRLQE